MTGTEPAAPLATSNPHAIEASGIVKTFPGVLANDHVDFDLRPGEIHALLGENGAGKSTLMNVLAGLYRPDEGGLRVDGADVDFRSPRDAIAAGIGMVHQHFALVPSQTVAENVLLGLDKPRFRLDLRRTEAEVERLAHDVGLRVDAGARIWQLSVGEQQRVEIVKMLFHGARVLILDEPTAVLAPQEIAELFATLRVDGGRRPERRLHQSQARRGAGHRRPHHGHARRAGHGGRDRSHDGHPRRPRPTDGRSAGPRAARAHDRSSRGESCSSVDDVSADNDRGVPALRGASLEVRAGEIVGVAAVAGNGQIGARPGRSPGCGRAPAG